MIKVFVLLFALLFIPCCAVCNTSSRDGVLHVPQYHIIVSRHLLTDIIENRNLHDGSANNVLSDIFFLTLNLNTVYQRHVGMFEAKGITLPQVYYRILRNARCGNEQDTIQLCSDISNSILTGEIYKYSSMYGTFYQTVPVYGTLDFIIPKHKRIIVDLYRPWFNRDLINRIGNTKGEQGWYVKSIILLPTDNGQYQVYGYILDKIFNN